MCTQHSLPLYYSENTVINNEFSNDESIKVCIAAFSSDQSKEVNANPSFTDNLM